MTPLRMLVTGANGFVGRALCATAAAAGLTVRGLVRQQGQMPAGVEQHIVEGLDELGSLRAALEGVDVVVHAAARAHVLRDASVDPLAEFRQVNVQGTMNVAVQAAAAGARRFIFISSVGVNGTETDGRPYRTTDEPRPQSAYAVSKHDAELRLHAWAAETGMEVVVIRPPLVYGPGAPGNFGTLMRWLMRGIPLPLGAVTNNRRSFVALDNLIDLIMVCAEHPAAAHQTFLVSDGEDLSTTDLLRRLSQAMNAPARLVPVRPALLHLCAAWAGKSDMAQRLLGSLQVDIAHTCRTLDWTPKIGVDEGLRRAAVEIKKHEASF